MKKKEEPLISEFWRHAEWWEVWEGIYLKTSQIAGRPRDVESHLILGLYDNYKRETIKARCGTLKEAFNSRFGDTMFERGKKWLQHHKRTSGFDERVKEIMQALFTSTHPTMHVNQFKLIVLQFMAKTIVPVLKTEAAIAQRNCFDGGQITLTQENYGIYNAFKNIREFSSTANSDTHALAQAHFGVLEEEHGREEALKFWKGFKKNIGDCFVERYIWIDVLKSK